MNRRILLVYNTVKYLYRFRRPLIEALQSRGLDVVAAAPVDSYLDKLRDLGVKTVPVFINSHSVNPVHDITTYTSLYRCMKRVEADTVFCFTIKPVIYGSIAASQVGTDRVYSMIPGLGSMFSQTGARSYLLKQLVMPMYRIALKGNRKVFFQNIESRDLFVKQSIVKPAQTVTVAGSGVDIEYYTSRKVCTQGDSVLMACRMLWQKGIEEFIQAARIVRIKYPEIKFVLAGPIDTSRDAVPAEYLQALDNNHDIEYVGEVTDLRPLIERARCVVLPTYYGEGVPRFLLEGMAMGRPIITTDVPGCRGLVRNGGNGVLIKPKDNEALAKAVERLLADSEMVREMGQKSRQLAVEEYDGSFVTEKILEEMDLGENMGNLHCSD